MKKSYEAQQTLHGHYGLAQKGDVIELHDYEAKELLANGVIKETKKDVTHPDRDVEAENKAIDKKHAAKGFIEDKTVKTEPAKVTVKAEPKAKKAAKKSAK